MTNPELERAPPAIVGRAAPAHSRYSRRVLSRLARLLTRTILALIAASIAAVVLYRFVDPPVTPLMLIRAAEALAHGERVAIDARWVNVRAVSPALLRAVIAAEDARFAIHHGIDLDAIDRARIYNARHATRRRGASTITMQCARNVFLWPGRTYVRKALEVYLALLMELVWGKERILEVYVNVAEWGPGVYGVEAAARRYFGVSAAALDLRQAALLAAVLPNPRRWSPAAPTPYLSARAGTIARRAADVRLD